MRLVPTLSSIQAARLVSLKTQIEHSIRKIENSNVLSGKVRKDEDRQKGTVAELQRNLAQVEALAKQAEDEQRRLSEKKGQALSEADLAEYRQLCVACSSLACIGCQAEPSSVAARPAGKPRPTRSFQMSVLRSTASAGAGRRSGRRLRPARRRRNASGAR
jgi:hypothetical protein